MLRAAAPAAHTAGFAHQLGKQGTRIAAISQKMTVTAVVAEDNVIGLQIMDDADRIGLLPQAGMGCAVKDPFGEIIQDCLFKSPDAV